MNTVLHHFHGEVRETMATVLAVHPVGEFEADHRPAIVLNETILAHQTEAWESDHGWIEDVSVVNVTKSPIGDVLHHLAGPENRFHPGQQVKVQLDLRRRECNARLLAAGRLLELVGPRVVPGLEAVASDFHPHRACVHFGVRGGECDYIPAPDSVWPDFCREVERFIALNLPVRTTVVDGASFRKVQFGDLPPFTCSGAYPPSLGKIGTLTISKIASVGGRLQVRYDVRENGQCNGVLPNASWFSAPIDCARFWWP